MKLIHHTLLYLSIILFITAGMWAILVYFQFFNQVKTTVDEGLSDHKIMIIAKLRDDSSITETAKFLENNYTLRRVGEDYALTVRDVYSDTLIWSDLKGKNYPVRLLTTAFLADDGKYYELKVISHELDRGSLIRKIASSLLLLLLLLFVSTIVTNNIVLKKTWKPFYRLLAYLDEFRLDTGAIPELSETRIREFSLLNDSVSKLLSLNSEIYNSQKQFIENAAHELQTPLAIAMNRLELLAGEEGLMPEQIQSIGEILLTLRRLSGLNRSLLLLSKIENKQFASVDAVVFNEIIEEGLKDFQDLSKHLEIGIRYIDSGSFKFNMNRDLAEIMLTNLLKNALVHNHRGGELIIRLEEKTLEIENTSKGPAIRSENLFKRFARMTEDKNSSGLGLAIVRAIAVASGLKVEYLHKNNHIFKVGPV